MANFFAYANLTAGDVAAEAVLLTFAEVNVCNKWWDIIQNTSWPKEIGIKKDNVKRSNPQWFSWPNAKGGAVAMMGAIESHDAMKPVKGDWTWKQMKDSNEVVIPLQDSSGTVITDSESRKKIAELEAQLKAAKDAPSPTSTAVAKTGGDSDKALATSGGKDWKGGARFEGGPQHYAMASDAFKMAMELKNRGDDRSFTMIFSQLNMEQRRTVGVSPKENPPGGYNSSKLIEDVYAKAKELKDRGDDRNFALIFASLSMASRRGNVQW